MRKTTYSKVSSRLHFFVAMPDASFSKMRRWCLTSTPRWRALRFLFLLVASAAAACVIVLSQVTEKRSTRHKVCDCSKTTFPINGTIMMLFQIKN